MFQQGNRKASKLTGEQVMEIRRLYATPGVSQPMLARQFKVSKNTIANIVNGTSWQGAAYGTEPINRPPIAAVDPAEASAKRVRAMLAENPKFVIPSPDATEPTGEG